MKRKIFSKLLMGAFLIASVSSFVSCKDYDDDINDLKDDVAKLALQSTVDNLQSQLSTAASTAQSALAKAEAAATQTALADVKAEATKAGENAAKGISDAANAQNAADAAAAAAKAANDLAAQAQAAADAAAKAAADAAAAGASKESVAAVEAAAKAAADAAAAAAKTAEEKATAAQSAAEATAKTLAADAQAAATKAANAYTDAEIAKIKAEIAKLNLEEKDAKALAEVAKLQAEVAKIAKLNEDLDALKAEIANLKVAAGDTTAFDALSTKVDGYDNAISQLFSMVTNVELIGTYTGTVKGAIKLNNVSYYVPFIYGKQATDESFGNNEDKFFQFAKEDQITYKKGDDIRTNKKILIRVNPTNAEFTKDQIQLVDSKGNDLSEFVTIGTPERYNALITRSIDNSGLWIIPVEVKDGVTKAAFNGKVLTEDKDYVAYAVAIKNEDTTDNRFVASTYDLTTRYVDYVPANYLNVNINGYSINSIANRWNLTYDADLKESKDGILGENNVDRQFDNPEYAWAIPGTPYDGISADKSNVIEAGKALTDAGLVIASPFNDRRRWGSDDYYLQVDVNEAIKLSNINSYVRRYYYDTLRKYYRDSEESYAEYYYVTLDLGNAVESRPSEENAWAGYEIEGINKMTPADEDLEIVIKDPKAAGDYIGFRLYAVNFDGTLVDPDGRAFYVHVAGEAPEQSAVVVSVTADTPYADFSGFASNAADQKQNVGTAQVSQSFVSLVPGGSSTGVFSGTVTYYLDKSAASGDSRAYVARTYSSNPAAEDIVKVKYWVLGADGKIASNWDKIASVKVSIDNPGPIVDNTTLPYIYVYGKTQNTGAKPTVNELYIAPGKVLPTTSPKAVEWRASLAPDANNVLTVYPQPAEFTATAVSGLYTTDATTINWDADWSGNSPKLLYKDLTNYINNESDFVDWTIAKKAGVGDTQIKLFTANPLHVAVSEASKIGNSYASNVIYDYGQLSTYYNYAQTYDIYGNLVDVGWQRETNHYVNAWTGTVKYANAMDLFAYSPKAKSWKWTDNSVNPTVEHSNSTTDFRLKWRSEVKSATSSSPVTKFYYNKVETYVNKANVTSELNFATTISNLVSNTTSNTNKTIARNAGITTDIADVTVNKVEFANYNTIKVTVTGDAATIVSVQLDDDDNPTQIEFFKKEPTATTTTVDDPIKNVKGSVVLTAKDIFGVSHTIVTIPFTVLFDK